jgi:hypothetical protein
MIATPAMKGRTDARFAHANNPNQKTNIESAGNSFAAAKAEQAPANKYNVMCVRTECLTLGSFELGSFELGSFELDFPEMASAEH